ncbi:hypothetical protein OB13_11670 [Pontibacter sp. HJ8]
MKQPQRKTFNYDLNFEETDFRKHPELYRVGKGEQGVLLVEPYKSEILPYWRFRTPEIAQESSDQIYRLFLAYLQQEDFVGADMARKYLQMGYTRSRRYANHRSGKKYDGPVQDDKKGQSGAHGREELPREQDPVKAESARIFWEKWQAAKENEDYKRMREEFKSRYEAKKERGRDTT